MAVRPIQPPDDDWLERVKLGEPHVLPYWPKGNRLALVLATREHKDPRRSARIDLFVVTSPEDVDQLSLQSQSMMLWFTVARHHLFREGVVPGLVPEDFPDVRPDRPDRPDRSDSA
jgi:hypothetical protein